MAERPPGFNPAQRQSSNKVWLWLLLAVAALCVLCVAGAFFGIKSLMNTGMGFVSCAVSGEMATDSILAYAMEHEGRLPNAQTWQDDIREYHERLYDKFMGSEDAKGMEFMGFKLSEPGAAFECSLGGGKKSGFAFNSALSGMLIADIEDPDHTILVFETPTPSYSAVGTPEGRDPNHPNLKMYGDTRGWMDFLVNGEMDSTSWDDASQGDMDFRMGIDPEDALTPGGQGTSGSGSN